MAKALDPLVPPRYGFAAIRLLPLSAISAYGCTPMDRGAQSMLAPQGPAALAIANISWIMFAGAAAILLLVMALACYAIYRKPERRRQLSANALIIGGGVAFPLVTLTALLVFGLIEMRKSNVAHDADPIAIEVTGHQWWWQVRYRNPGSKDITGANEIHIAAGRPVQIALRSHDVIHSFWVPRLSGKVDLIPGRQNHITLHASRPGRFRGQCAEFCGAQHARMAMQVIAHTPDDYAAWLAARQAGSMRTTGPAALRGRDAFIGNNCIACHAVDGDRDATYRGPDLSHVASRQFLAAGTLPNNRGNLISLIADIQKIKPGAAMPAYPELQQQTLQDLAAYLESLR